MNGNAVQRQQQDFASTSSTALQHEEMDAFLNVLNDMHSKSLGILQKSLQERLVLQRLRHALIDQASRKEACDAFRRDHGFQALLKLLQTLAEAFKPSELSRNDIQNFFVLLKDALAVLGAALQGSSGNQKYFRKEVDEGGWQALSTSLEKLQQNLCREDACADDVGQYLGIILATALDEETLYDLFTVLLKEFQDYNIHNATTPVETFMTSSGQATLIRYLHGVDHIPIPDLLPQILNYWSACPVAESGERQVLGVAVAEIITRVMGSRPRNLVAMHTVALSQSLLPLVFDPRRSEMERSSYQHLALSLFQAGIGSLEVPYAIYREAARSSEAVRFLLKAVQASRCPASIHFDLSEYGYCSVELAALGKPFPPTTSSGYTLSVWALFEEFDPRAHTTIFGAFDATQKCFVLVYLEKDTKHIILQTAIKGSKPSVRFKSTSFHSSQWYHICLVHRKPRSMSSSKASLFVNGEFCEQLKAAYPSVPPVDPNHRVPRVQTFFGTPQDLAVGTKKTEPSSQWLLASSVLFADTFSDDLISVFYHLGPRYYGNFQDCLGSFQTYAASAALNVRHENLHPGADERSDILSAVRLKASNLVSESSILINIAPSAVLDGEDRNNIDESQLVKSLSKLAAKNLRQYTLSAGNAIVINAAVPAVDEALSHGHGVAVLTGDPIVTVPQSLDDATWRMGGCTAVVLTLVCGAKTTQDLALVVETLFEIVRSSWRNSEAMEKDQGYAILAILLRDKLGLGSPGPAVGSSKVPVVVPTATMDRNQLSMSLLKLILEFVGYNFHQPERSTINNPLAYRILLVDTDIWRQSERPIQELYYQQFMTFAVESQNHRFNGRRLARMRVLKKLLDALKGEPMMSDNMPLFNDAFNSLLPGALSAEVLRSIALFITFSVHKRKQSSLVLPVRKHCIDGRRRRSTQSGHPEPSSAGALSRFQIGVEILRLYSNSLCSKEDTSVVKRFARTVTNKWLLYLLSESSPEVVILSTKILARVLAVHGSSYVKKFDQKSGGFVIMRHRLKRWWHLPSLWSICFGILFDIDVSVLDLDRPFDLFGLIDVFGRNGFNVVNPAMFVVMIGMLQSGLKAIATSKSPFDASTLDASSRMSIPSNKVRISMSNMAALDPFVVSVADRHVETLHVVIRFFNDLHTRSQRFRDFAVASTFVQDLLAVLFPVVVGSDIVNADLELSSRDSALQFDGAEVVIRPLSTAPAALKTSVAENGPMVMGRRGPHLRRGSSFVIVPSVSPKHQPSSSRLHHEPHLSPVGKTPQVNDGNAVVQSLLELVIAVYTDQILGRKDFTGLGLFLKTPPGFLEHQTYFESWILRNLLSQLNNAILLNQKILWEPRVLSNLARLFSHVGEALYEGWFIGGAGPSLDFSGSVIEYLQRSDVAQIKSVRLCSQAIAVIRTFMFRTVLLSLSQVQDDESLPFLAKLGYWQTVLLSAEETHSEYLQLICYLLYASLIASEEAVRMSAANLWRIILVQKPNEASAILKQATSSQHRSLVSSFEKLVELDNETFLYWVDSHRDDLDSLFFSTLAGSWDKFVTEENFKTAETAKQRVAKRRDKLTHWARIESSDEDVIRRHEVTFDHWTTNIYTSELLKHQRTIQDQQDNMNYTLARFEKMSRAVELPVGFKPVPKAPKWRLDQTEGRNRMRLRITPEVTKAKEVYRPKRKSSPVLGLKLETSVARSHATDAVGLTPVGVVSVGVSPVPDDTSPEPFPDVPVAGDSGHSMEKPDLEEGFELVDDPKDDLDGYEDKNRKVMRSLHRGDQVQNVWNISRIIGMEAAEGLLILGKDHLYLLDHFFQRADGEIVNVWQASQEERDPYVRMISGREFVERRPVRGLDERETRSWKWGDVISVSKRRFLFRDVALELFFADGRSYLLTAMTPTARNDLHNVIISKTPQVSAENPTMRSEDTWRFETLRSPDDEPQSFGSRVATVFGQAAANPATRRWVKGEISNFHYLMLINTMAGRTFNDLTQYPVFPWVLADYTSEELDLDDPSTFRDLSKPMGCQTPEREVEYRDRYVTFGEMGDDSSPAFHYGTHYSSAMIVTSYLIRLEPFIKSYLLLQGGSFDHADRLFYSIEKAWKSASRINMADVRELTPEFFYLPEFLVNVNGYDFGRRQDSSQSISSVELPRWAKGDAKIFIAKQREALESPHVSRNLHRWIDLVFGYKQKGEAAVEAVNVFHHLSYQGSKDLDRITDAVERLATIGIIHNFGQTPYQVFPKAHPAREELRHPYRRLDTAAESLTQLPFEPLHSEERIASLSFSWKQDRLLCSAAFRVNIPPNYDKYMEWGFTDGSLRFHAADSRKLLGHFEHVHVGQLSVALFADSRTLVTAGTDCTVSVWTLLSNGKTVDLQARSSLFGHRSSVHVLAVSRSFSALLSASTDGTVILWDLNRLEFVRILSSSQLVERAKINDVNGNIMICQRNQITLYTLNAELILEQGVGDRAEDVILCCAFYEGAGNEWLEREILFTGHPGGVVKVWNKVVCGRGFALEMIRQLNHMDRVGGEGRNVPAGISCILPMPQMVYTGDEAGNVVSFFSIPVLTKIEFLAS